MKNKTYVFYNDMETRSFEATKDYLFETFAEEEGWLSIDEIPDCVVYHEIELEQRSEWDDFMADLDYIFSKDTYLLTGLAEDGTGPPKVVSSLPQKTSFWTVSDTLITSNSMIKTGTFTFVVITTTVLTRMK